MSYPEFGGHTSDPASTFPAPEPVSFDEPVIDEPADVEADVEVEEEHTSEAPSKKAARRKTPARTTRLTPAQVRRVLTQQALIAEQDENVLDVLAAVLGVNADTEELVVATLTATKAPAEAITELEALAGITSPYEKVVAAIGIAADRENARRVWGLLGALGKVDGAIPAKEAQAGAKIAEAVDTLDLADLTALSTVTELLGA